MRQGLTIGAAPDFKMALGKMRLTHLSSIVHLDSDGRNKRKIRIADYSLWNLARITSEHLKGLGCDASDLDHIETVVGAKIEFGTIQGKVLVAYRIRKEVIDRYGFALDIRFRKYLGIFLQEP